MKGWPLARALFALFLLLLAGLPLDRLTAPRSMAAMPVAAPVAAPPTQAPTPLPPVPEKVVIELTFTQPPQSFSLVCAGQEILRVSEGTAFDYRREAELICPPEGLEFQLVAAWAEHFRKVGAAVKIIRAAGQTESQTVWGRKEISAPLKFAAAPAQTPEN